VHQPSLCVTTSLYTGMPRLAWLSDYRACRSLEQDAVGNGTIRLGAATWRTGRIICVNFDFGQFAPLCENTTSSTKTWST